MIRDSVTCDRTGCLAVALEPDDLPDGVEFEDYIRALGWTSGFEAHAPGPGHTCPACRLGRPVDERGECTRCSGRMIPTRAGDHCIYCSHLHPSTEETTQ